MSRDWDESEHPRWPAETPEGRGGEFRGASSPVSWLDRVGGLLAGFMTHGQIASYRERTDYTDSPMTGGGSATVTLREFDDGTRLVIKEHGYEEEADNEYKASHIGWAIGAPVPAVVGDLHDSNTTWSQYIVGDRASERIHGWRTWDEFAEKQSELAMSLEGSFELGLLDYLINNQDRHSGNWIITPPVRGGPKAVGIDHGHIDNLGTDVHSIVSPFVEWIISDYGNINDLTGAISRAELDEIARRISSLAETGDIDERDRDKLLKKIRDLRNHTDR